jgi:hypothetical protein
MRSGPIMTFWGSEKGGLTVEFVAVIGPFLLLSFFIMESLIAMDWVGTAEKAAQLGARLAVVSNPAVPTGTCPAGGGSVSAGLLPLINCKPSAIGVYGQPCPANCAAWAGSPITCAGGSGGTCSATDFTTIVNRMTSIAPLLSEGCAQAQPGCHVTISYADSQLGFSGGPTIPDVTVKISGVPYGAVVTTILGAFFGGNSVLTVLPDISVTLTGEDLSSAGA